MGIEKEIDLSFLTGRELIQVAIGSFQVQFHFDEDVAVSVEAEFRYFDGQQEWTWPHVLKWTSSDDSGFVQGTESYDITRPGHTIIV